MIYLARANVKQKWKAGFANVPNKKVSFWAGMKGTGGELTLPGLEGFYFAGVWASMAPSLFGNALSGRHAIQAICRKEGKRFEAPAV